MDTKLKIAKRFILGLNLEIHRTVEAIDPTTYKTALRLAKAMEKPRDRDMNSTPYPFQPTSLGALWESQIHALSNQERGSDFTG